MTTRAGGVSGGRCESLNVSYTVGDLSQNVDENLRRVADAVGTDRDSFIWPYQVHGRAVTVVDEHTPQRERCDVLITRTPGKTLLLRYADCAPVLLADTRQNAVAAVHAGWRGSAVRAASAAVEALEQVFGSRPRDLVAGIGPAIGPCCYEVGADVHDALADRPWLFADGRLDLWQANRHALLEAGVPSDNVEVAGICTQCESQRFFSHRANGGQPAGRFAAVIRLAC
ncbi:MAG TPA: peptidoglycan editing factor PgeF [Chloroflexota bacterium]|nr:peptidoglycan editing factor PgeF [Chloroflexota bacterium]